MHVSTKANNEGVKNPVTNATLEFDVLVPKLNLAFEYQVR
jgi:hypothetical protein